MYWPRIRAHVPILQVAISFVVLIKGVFAAKTAAEKVVKIDSPLRSCASPQVARSPDS